MEIKEPKSLKEVNELIKERQQLQEGLKKFDKKVANYSECGEKHLSLLCKSTKPIHNVRKLILFFEHFYSVHTYFFCFSLYLDKS